MSDQSHLFKVLEAVVGSDDIFDVVLCVEWKAH